MLISCSSLHNTKNYDFKEDVRKSYNIENAEKKDVKIIMQLNDNLDFKMSFGM